MNIFNLYISTFLFTSHSTFPDGRLINSSNLGRFEERYQPIDEEIALRPTQRYKLDKCFDVRCPFVVRRSCNDIS